MTSQELNRLAQDAAKKLNIEHWNDDPAAVVKLLPDGVLELSANESVLEGNDKVQWEPRWVKACKEELANRAIENIVLG